MWKKVLSVREELKDFKNLIHKHWCMDIRRLIMEEFWSLLVSLNHQGLLQNHLLDSQRDKDSIKIWMHQLMKFRIQLNRKNWESKVDSKVLTEVLHQVETQLNNQPYLKCLRNSWPIISMKNKRKLLKIINQELNQSNLDRDLVQKDQGYQVL